MTDVAEPAELADEEEPEQQSLGRAAARKLASTNKTPPQMREVTPRWLLRRLPWENVAGGTFRVNRRLAYPVDNGLVGITIESGRARAVPQELGELPLLRGFDDEAALTALADGFEQREFGPGEIVASAGESTAACYLVATGKVVKVRASEYGEETIVDLLAGGEFFGDRSLAESEEVWEATFRAVTACSVLELSRATVARVSEGSPALAEHLRTRAAEPPPAVNRRGEARIELASGHDGEPSLPGTFVDYDPKPAEYALNVSQTVLRVHTRVADLYNEPMNQTEQQLKLTVQVLRERQEYELINHPDFGLLRNIHPRQRVKSRTGRPTPDDFDELLGRRRKSRLFLAHPRAIAAFGRECNRRGICPSTAEVDGCPIQTWRNVPIFPCNKLPVGPNNVSPILCMRAGLEDEGVVGLHQTGIPDEYEPSLSVRFMDITEKAIIRYLVSVYYSVAIPVPDAVGVLDSVDVGR